MNLRKKFATAAAAGVLSVTALAVGAGSAQADSQWGGYDNTGQGVGLRTCAYTSCSEPGVGWPDQHALMYCYVIGQNIYGDSGWAWHEHYLADWTDWGAYYSADHYLWWNNSINGC